jgi:hypothetical protein
MESIFEANKNNVHIIVHKLTSVASYKFYIEFVAAMGGVISY